MGRGGWWDTVAARCSRQRALADPNQSWSSQSTCPRLVLLTQCRRPHAALHEPGRRRRRRRRRKRRPRGGCGGCRRRGAGGHRRGRGLSSFAGFGARRAAVGMEAIGLLPPAGLVPPRIGGLPDPVTPLLCSTSPPLPGGCSSLLRLLGEAELAPPLPPSRSRPRQPRPPPRRCLSRTAMKTGVITTALLRRTPPTPGRLRHRPPLVRAPPIPAALGEPADHLLV